MKTLLAIISEPRDSKGFIRYVAQMAANLKSKVHILHVHTPTTYPLGTTPGAMGQGSLQMQAATEEIAENTKIILNRYINEVSAEISSDVFSGFSSEIGGTELIADQIINEGKIDMAIIESRQEVSFWTQTSNNIDLIRELNCPVWIIPKGEVYTPIKNIVYATDYNEEDITNVKKLIDLFSDQRPNITALHITDSRDFNDRIKKAGFKDMLQEKVSYPNLIVKAIHRGNDDDVAELLSDFAETNNTDLVVVLKQNKSFFEGLFKANHTKEILKKSELPVLVFREKE